MDKLDEMLNTKPIEDIEEMVNEVLSQADFDIRKKMQENLPYTREVSVNDIVPEEYQHKLMEIDFTMTKCFWLIGDITNDIINGLDRIKCAEYGKIVSQKDIYRAVGYFCHRTERTIRYYWEIARYFPLEVREKYEIPYTMFVGARWVDNWELFLKIADSNPSWSTDKVRLEYYKMMGENLPVRNLHKDSADLPVLAQHEDDLDLPVLSLHNKKAREIPPEGEVWNGYSYKDVVLGKLEHTVDDLRMVLNRINLPSGVRIRIGEIITDIQNITLEIRREV